MLLCCIMKLREVSIFSSICYIVHGTLHLWSKKVWLFVSKLIYMDKQKEINNNLTHRLLARRGGILAVEVWTRTDHVTMMVRTDIHSATIPLICSRDNEGRKEAGQEEEEEEDRGWGWKYTSLLSHKVMIKLLDTNGKIQRLYSIKDAG